MSVRDDDRDLERAFEALRSQERSVAPEFAGMWMEARRRRRLERRASVVRRSAWGGLAAAATISAAAILIHSGGGRPGGLTDDQALAVARAMSSWEAPSDTLPEVAATTRILSIEGNLTLDSVTLPEFTASEGSERRTP